MRAIVCTGYGPPEVLQLCEVARPTPEPDEVLIRVVYTTVHVGDVRIRAFDVPRGQRLMARLVLGVRRQLDRARGRRCLKPGGAYLDVIRDSGSAGGVRTDDLVFLTGLVDRGTIRAAIDRRYPLEQIVEAHRYVGLGHKAGHVVITVSDAPRRTAGAADAT